MTGTPWTLEERLRQWGRLYSAGERTVLDEAADEIASLRARVEEDIARYLESVAVKRSDKMKIAAIRDGSYLKETKNER